MTVTGTDIIENCRACFSANGYGIKLSKTGDVLVCSIDSGHRYKLSGGMLEKV